MFSHIEPYVSDIVAFRKLDIGTQLDLLGDIIAYWATKKVEALDEAGKTRTDSCLPAQRFELIEKQWIAYNLNLKKKIDLKIEELKRGV